MSRYFMIQSWVGSHENEPDYNGQQCGERNVRSTEAVPLYDQYGNANVSAFSDEAIAARNAEGKKPTKVPLKNRILPQSARVEKLRSEAIELEAAFKAGEFTAEEYTLLRDVAFKKLRRSEELLKKAITPVEKEPETDEDTQQVEAETTYSSCDVHYSNTPTASSNWLDDFIAELPVTNSFRNPLKTALHMTRKAVEFSQRVKAYYQTLKEV